MQFLLVGPDGSFATSTGLVGVLDPGRLVDVEIHEKPVGTDRVLVTMVGRYIPLQVLRVEQKKPG